MKTNDTIDCTPTWSGVLPILTTMLSEGDTQARIAALLELERMARLADKWVAHCKEVAS